MQAARADGGFFGWLRRHNIVMNSYEENEMRNALFWRVFYFSEDMLSDLHRMLSKQLRSQTPPRSVS